MSDLSSTLSTRSGNKCELCSETSKLTAYIVPPKTGENDSEQIVICQTCHSQIVGETELTANHWRCLNESMWSEVPAVQVMAYRLLKQLDSEGWAGDLLNMLYLDEASLTWAQHSADEAIVHKDSNGHVLTAGDSVVLIQDLKVKGANFTAKRGTAVRRIRLDPDNAEHIEGKVDGQQIVILTKYVKKI